VDDRILNWRFRAANMRARALAAVTPSDARSFEMLAQYWDGLADEAERTATRRDGLEQSDGSKGPGKRD
jgi:hypothetical protein